MNQDPIGLVGGEHLYSFAPNSQIWIDPLGLRGSYATADAAARAALTKYNPISIRKNREYGGYIYQMPNGKFGYTTAVKGTIDGLDLSRARNRVPSKCTIVGDYHTHGNYVEVDSQTGKIVSVGNPNKDSYLSNDFSKTDIDGNNAAGIIGYLGTPSGVFKKCNPATGLVSIL